MAHRPVVRIEVINTGTELLLGNTMNTHGAWFGRELFMLGLRISRQTTVPDGDAIREALEEAVRRADVVIVTGGLGPTSDDLTREITAQVLGLELITDEAALRSLESYFTSRGRVMVAANLKQALCPVGADILPNPNGTAPGIYVPPRLNGRSNAAVFLLPGPPREIYQMYHAELVPRLRARRQTVHRFSNLPASARAISITAWTSGWRQSWGWSMATAHTSAGWTCG